MGPLGDATKPPLEAGGKERGPSGRITGSPFGLTDKADSRLLKRHHGCSVVNTLFDMTKPPPITSGGLRPTVQAGVSATSATSATSRLRLAPM